MALQLLYAMLCILTLLLQLGVSADTDSKSTKIAAAQTVSTDQGSECHDLEDPEHGRYVCKQTHEAKYVCRLVCDRGYLHPVTEYYGQEHIPLEDRGVYTCEEVATGRTWKPNLFYDCVEKKGPAYFKIHYGFQLSQGPTTCQKTKNRSESEILAPLWSAVDQGLAFNRCADAEEMGRHCFWTFAPLCVNDKLEVDAVFTIPYAFSLRATFHLWYQRLIVDMETDIETAQKLGQYQEKVIQSKPRLYMECPPGTRLERDYTCRGCSKGYYMSKLTFECAPCDEGYYQDETLQYSCKKCPPGLIRPKKGVQHVLDCFYAGTWIQNTSIYTVLASLVSLVAVSTVLLAFRSQVKALPDGTGYENQETQDPRMTAEEIAATVQPQVGEGSVEGQRLSSQDVTVTRFEDDYDEVAMAEMELQDWEVEELDDISDEVDFVPRRSTKKSMDYTNLDLDKIVEDLEVTAEAPAE